MPKPYSGHAVARDSVQSVAAPSTTRPSEQDLVQRVGPPIKLYIVYSALVLSWVGSIEHWIHPEVKYTLFGYNII